MFAERVKKKEKKNKVGLVNLLFVSVVVIVLLFVSFFVFQNELSIFFVNLTKTKSVSFWSNVSEQPIWMLTKTRFVGLPPDCLNNGYNGYHDPQTFSDTAYCSDVVCSNGTLLITGTNESECTNLSDSKCNYGLLDKSTGLCVMQSCSVDSDCVGFSLKPTDLPEKYSCATVICKSFGKGILIPETSQKIPAVKVCSCA